MGLFRSRDNSDPIGRVEDLVQGRSFNSKLTRAFMGKHFVDQATASVQLAREAQTAAALQQHGSVSYPATVETITDTGELINYNPVVDIVARFDNGTQFTLHAIVSKIAAPIPGTRILVAQHPQQPGQYLYQGIVQ